ncbi:MAG: hypothetical protein ACK5HY_12490 [Parahaliea sp.]
MIMRLLRWLLFAALLLANILTLTWSTATAALSGLLGAVGVRSVYGVMEQRQKAQATRIAAQQKRLALQQGKLRKVGGNIRKRTVRAAAANIGSLPAEAVPFFGWAVIIGVTTYELKLACDTLNDLDELYLEVGLAPDSDREATDLICHPDLERLSEASSTLPTRLRKEYGRYLEWVNEDGKGE